MTRNKEKFFRRFEWPNGPWLSEPNLIEWIDVDTGFSCRIVRQHIGHLCGYVGVDSSHPLFGVEYTDYDRVDLSVHGGITYSDQREDGLWYFGFDCAHAGDFTPAMAGMGIRADPERYRDVDYVKSQVSNLCSQLASITDGR